MMQEPLLIKKIAILGAGVMGAQIAAHCINAGFATLLFDLGNTNGNKNELINKAINNLRKLKPAPLAIADTASLIKACNYDEDLPLLKDCDLIIEAIAEKLTWKEELYNLIQGYIGKNAILASNTSGLSINHLAQILPQDLQQRFCGIHFFNPPRYMHLVELIAAECTDSELMSRLESWLTGYLGKGVVRAKDTPNFIANRIGVFSLVNTCYHAARLNLNFAEVDALTGTLIGRPKSATFRTMDVVGLDTMLHVVKTMEQQLPDDPWHKFFVMPAWFTQMVAVGALGQKTGQGIYRKKGKNIEVFVPESNDYQELTAKVSEDLLAIFKVKDLKERFKLLVNSTNVQAQFLAACFIDLWHYAAYHLADIANTVKDVDLAMCWGFGWQHGPFTLWQNFGFKEVQEIIASQEKLMPLPSWLANLDSFYQDNRSYSPVQDKYVHGSDLPVYNRQFFSGLGKVNLSNKTKTIFANNGLRLYELEDEIAVISFKTKANTINQEVLDGLEESLAKIENRYQGLVIYQEDPLNFSCGADLKGIALLIKNQQWAALEAMVLQLQNLVMKLKYASLPIVAAPRGKVLGGGCELMLHCPAVVGAFEMYPGLVEVGVGLIPAGGGSKEMALRAAESAKEHDIFLFLQPIFQQLATGFVAGSAIEAQQRSYLRATDNWVMHKDEVLFAACAKIKYLQANNFCSALPKNIKVAGLETHTRFQAGLVNWLEGKFISQHDYLIANELAGVLCGGNLNRGTEVNEAWFLTLERQAFMKLAATPLTLQRISYLLENGKPLRN